MTFQRIYQTRIHYKMEIPFLILLIALEISTRSIDYFIKHRTIKFRFNLIKFHNWFKRNHMHRFYNVNSHSEHMSIQFSQNFPQNFHGVNYIETPRRSTLQINSFFIMCIFIKRYHFSEFW